MEQIGVEAVVSQLTKFLSDMVKVDQGISKVAPSGTLLQRVFASLGETVSAFGREILNVAEYALGKILGDSIQFIVNKIRELIISTIEAGQEFQTLSLRLDRLNFNEIRDSAGSYTEAMARATQMTKEQLDWIQKLAAQTPYDNQDIANVYTLARSYGFAASESQGLTQDILQFAAGMGLSSVEMERIIVNFGQMTAQGKVSGRELTDLARGAFVPVNRILEQMQKNTGLAGAEFDAFRNSAAGVEAFMLAFSQVVANDFSGAAEKMARTFKGATDNAADMVKSIMGLNIVKPILDSIGGKIADFLGEFTEGQTIIQDFNGHMVELASPTRWDQLVSAASRIGVTLSGIVTSVLGLLPSTESIADNVVASVEGIADWIEGHKGDILEFFKGIGDTIQEKVVPFIEKVVDAFGTVSDWVSENKGTISEFFTTLGEIASEVIEDLTGQQMDSGGGLTGFLETLTKVMKFVITNKNSIVKAIDLIVIGFIAFQIVETILLGVLAVVSMLIGFVTGLATVVGTVMGVIGTIQFLMPVLTLIGTLITGVVIPAVVSFIAILGAMIWPILLVISIIALLVLAFNTDFAAIGETIDQLWFIIKNTLAKIISNFIAFFFQLGATARVRFTEMVDGVKTGLFELAVSIEEWAVGVGVSIAAWATNTTASISGWASATKSSISNWVSNVGGSITSWATTSKTKIIEWSASTRGVISAWTTSSLASITTWINDSIAKFASWADNAYATVQSSVARINWFGIGASIITQIISGFLSKTLPSIAAPDVAPPPPSSGGGGCFIAGTKVLMSDKSLKNIEDVEVGDQVVSYDTENKEFVVASVTHALHHHERPQPYYLVMNCQLKVTPNHPMYINGEWIEAGEIKIGDVSVNSEGEGSIIHLIERVDERLVIYNIHTDHDVHNYFADGYLVHNAAPKDTLMATSTGGVAGTPSPSVAATSVVNSSVTINNEFNLSVHSNANSEDIVQDFNLMQSMAGG